MTESEARRETEVQLELIDAKICSKNLDFYFCFFLHQFIMAASSTRIALTSPQFTLDHLVSLTQQLLDSIATNDWSTYSRLCDPQLTCFEPEVNNYKYRSTQDNLIFN